MNTKQVLMLVGVGLLLTYQQEKLRQKQIMQQMLIEHMGDCIQTFQEFVEQEYQRDVDEAFEDIVSENFEEGN